MNDMKNEPYPFLSSRQSVAHKIHRWSRNLRSNRDIVHVARCLATQEYYPPYEIALWDTLYRLVSERRKSPQRDGFLDDILRMIKALNDPGSFLPGRDLPRLAQDLIAS